MSTARPNGWPAKQLPSSIKRTTWSSWPTLADLAEVLLGAGKHAEAVTEFQASRDTYRRKGPPQLANVELETAWRKSPMNNPAALACPACGADNPEHARLLVLRNCACDRCHSGRRDAQTVTVLFCDLVGSTAIGEQLDPETLRGLLTARSTG